MKAIIFDFNGTMFKDTHIQFAAWKNYMRRRFDMELDWDTFVSKVCGPQNRDIFRALLNRDVSADEVKILAGEKEESYRAACLAQEGGMQLTQGLEKALDALKAKGVPMTIASGSPEENLRFYWQQFRLDRWFDWEKFVYDDGTLPGKPDPAMYLRASEKIGFAPQDCVVVEDAVNGVLSAQRAGIGRIFFITGTLNAQEAAHVGGIHRVIQTFDGFETLF